ncbi:hypothetical protein J5N97_024444 [Dioscorea zingiberensis]|uniref:FAD-binding domain-containing protein n=1 Tax=Dioscorea zingiberensis TaxID=325984 RepID=A0A9D5C7U0_9LILI|nr:hypothetical protein J5N97_024444 [Dioscorea zingiberensis]
MEEVVIVGGGIAGLATAVALRRVGFKCLVLERAAELRAAGAAIGLFPNAFKALDSLGVTHKFLSIYRPMEKAYVVNVDSGVSQEVSFTSNASTPGEETQTRCVHRKALLEALAEELPPNTIRFSSKLASIKTEKLNNSSSLVYVLHLEDGSVIRTKVLIGCDGLYSVVAQWLGLSAPVKSGRSAVRGLAVFPEGHGFPYGPRQYLSNSKRAGFMPLNDKELYWFMTHRTIDGEHELARDPQRIQKEVIENLAKDFPEDYLNVVKHSDLSNLTIAPLNLRVPWDVFFGKTYSGTATVVGDAFHPMTPDMGQGGCMALEDAVVLARSIANKRDKVAEGIENYVKERRWRVTSVLTGAFFSGWVQQGGSGVLWRIVELFRDSLFYKIVFAKMHDSIDKFDCGVLPCVSKD